MSPAKPNMIMTVVGTTPSGDPICRFVPAKQAAESGPSLAQLLGDRLRELRHESDLALADVGTALGFDAQLMGHWEQGLFAPAKAQVRALAGYFGVTERQMRGLDPLPPIG